MSEIPVDCAICVEPVVDNRQCPHCRRLFCAVCLHRWLSSHHQQALAQPTCPTCRASLDEKEFHFNAELQGVADKTVVMVPCPYFGCTVMVPHRDLDAHTYSCKAREQYPELYHHMLAANSSSASSAASENLRSQRQLDIEQLQEDIRRNMASHGVDTMLHYVAEADTIEGIAIRYHTTVSDIRNMNRMHNGQSIFTFYSLIVPRPEGPVASSPALSPAVIEALKKRRCIKQFMRVTQEKDPCEAIAYLNLVDYNVDKAVAKFQDDVDWERSCLKDKKDFGAFMKRVATNPVPVSSDKLSRSLESEARLSRQPCGVCVVRAVGDQRTICVACESNLCLECAAKVKKVTMDMVVENGSIDEKSFACGECYVKLCEAIRDNLPPPCLKRSLRPASCPAMSSSSAPSSNAKNGNGGNSNIFNFSFKKK